MSDPTTDQLQRGQVYRFARTKVGLSAADVARNMGIPTATLKRIEDGDAPAPFDFDRRLARAINTLILN